MAERINLGMRRMHERAQEVEALRHERVKLAQDFRDGVQSMASTLAGASTELDATATTLAEAAGGTVTQVGRGSTAAEDAVAAIHAVASAAEQLTASISEIAHQAERSNQSTRTASSEARAAGAVMSDLASAAQGVSGIVQVISDVARQTNLLALNAAIEAARAGDAGRGFGVVASEVKQLANQNARSTQDIADRISAMRAATERGVAGIDRIGSALEEAEGFASTISAAIYQQETATQHIAKNAEQATTSARTVAGELQGIQGHAASARNGAHDIQTSAGEISLQSERLLREVDSFLNRMGA
jgi:methyl-accepting chemotaxis protein